MLYKFRHFISYILLIAALLGGSIEIKAQDYALHQLLRFAPGTSHADLTARIARGTSHVYHLHARQGQYMTVVLKTGNNTSFSIYSTRAGQIENAAGVQDWDGNLPETGEYIIEISTAKSANYTMMVSVE